MYWRRTISFSCKKKITKGAANVLLPDWNTRMGTQINTNLHGVGPEPRTLNCLRMDVDRPFHTELMAVGKQIYKLRRSRACHARAEWLRGKNHFSPLANKRIGQRHRSTSCSLSKDMQICLQSRDMLQLLWVPICKWNFHDSKLRKEIKIYAVWIILCYRAGRFLLDREAAAERTAEASQSSGKWSTLYNAHRKIWFSRQ